MSEKSVYILACAVRNKGSGFRTGYSKASSVSSNVGVVASCNDRRATSRLHEDDTLVVRSGPAAAAIAADDHDDDEENRAANHSSLTTIVHFMPPSQGTLIKKCLHEEYLNKGYTFQYIKARFTQIIAIESKDPHYGGRLSRIFLWIFLSLQIIRTRNTRRA